MTEISSQEGMKKFREMKDSTLEKRRKEVEIELNLFGLDKEDKDLIIQEISKLTNNENTILKLVNRQLNQNKKVNQEKIVKEAIEKIDHIRRKKYFYVTLAYMKKQNKINKNLLRLNGKVVKLTVLVLIFMGVQIFLILLQILD